VPEADAALVRDGDEARVRVQALDNAEWTAPVARTSWSVDAGARTLRVEVDLPKPGETLDPRLRPGMYAYVRVTVPMPEAWVLPAAAVVKAGDATVCYRVVDGRAVRTPIRSGRTDGKFTEVFQRQKPDGGWEDFTADDAVIADKAAALSDGQEVAVTEQ
jgi:membrane fusion protein (multidrug efflux system)